MQVLFLLSITKILVHIRIIPIATVTLILLHIIFIIHIRQRIALTSTHTRRKDVQILTSSLKDVIPTTTMPQQDL